MTDNRPITRSQASQSLLPSNTGKVTKTDDSLPGDSDIQSGDAKIVPNNSGDATGQGGSIDGATLIASVQSLGQTLANYSERVSVLEEMVATLTGSGNPAPPEDHRMTGGTESSVAVTKLRQPEDLHQSAVCSHHVTSCTVPAGLARHVAKPGEFDGSGSWSSFIAQFKAIASAQVWTERDRLAILVASLKGSALEFFAHLSTADQTDFHRLIDALEGRYGAANQEPWFRSQLRSRRRNAGETLPQLAQQIERLVSLAYPTAPMELRDSLACDYFLDALDDADLHIAVRQGRPSSLPQALASAIEIESVRGAAGLIPRSPNSGAAARQAQTHQASSDTERQEHLSQESTVTRETLAQILRALNDMQRSLAESSRSDRRFSAARRQPTGTCWECGLEGHLRRQCPRLRNSNPCPSTKRQGNE